MLTPPSSLLPFFSFLLSPSFILYLPPSLSILPFLYSSSLLSYILFSPNFSPSISPPQTQRLPAAVLDWRTFSRCSKQLSSALHYSVDSLLRSSNSLVNNNWSLGLSLEDMGKVVLGGSRSDMAKFARSQHSMDKATFAIHEISCTYYR